MAKRPLPVVMVDEHITPALSRTLVDRRCFRVLRAGNDRRFRGRDESDYLPELRSLNIVFVTQDAAFVKGVLSQRAKHGGIVWLPADKPAEWLVWGLWWASGAIQRHLLVYGVHGMRDVVIRVDQHGIRSIYDGHDDLSLSWSWDSLRSQVEIYQRTRRAG